MTFYTVFLLAFTPGVQMQICVDMLSIGMLTIFLIQKVADNFFIYINAYTHVFVTCLEKSGCTDYWTTHIASKVSKRLTTKK